MFTIIALLAIAQTGVSAASTAAPTIQDEIIVIGRKLRNWRGSLKTKGGATRCVTKKSTGDRDIDQIGCDAMVTCFLKFEGEFRAVLSASRDKISRNSMNADISQRLAACVEERHNKLKEALADRRAAGLS
ncbi:hypothetical protein U1701_17765 [Sphingomonas sp. PB2P19]|uniref:hypothetical protein n=1 Tax=Sphingomonas rhamnosi TaxID=3096156 RepID=UPI002FCCB799